MEQQDYVKEYKNLYLPKKSAFNIDVETMPFIMISSQGDPNGPGFEDVVGALYSFAYTIKFLNKGKNVPTGYFPYRVFPLEGIWDMGDITKPVIDKSNYVYTMMIRQPDFVDQALFEKTREEVKKEKAQCVS